MENTNKACRFSFCFWAKLAIAIPALTIIAYIAASFFAEPWLQVAAALAAVAIAIYAAIWLDRIPALQRKVRKS